MYIFRKMAEKRERDEREARMLVRLHGEEALTILDDRIVKTTDSRSKAHWKRVKKIARDALRAGLEQDAIEQVA